MITIFFLNADNFGQFCPVQKNPPENSPLHQTSWRPLFGQNVLLTTITVVMLPQHFFVIDLYGLDSVRMSIAGPDNLTHFANHPELFPSKHLYLSTLSHTHSLSLGSLQALRACVTDYPSRPPSPTFNLQREKGKTAWLNAAKHWEFVNWTPRLFVKHFETSLATQCLADKKNICEFKLSYPAATGLHLLQR